MNLVRRASGNDAEAIARIHAGAFPRQRDSAHWVAATLAASPRIFVYIIENDADILGYVFWAQKSGIRDSAVIELDQIAIREDRQGRGLASALIRQSLALLESALAANTQSIQSIWISTRSDNPAKDLYTRVLGARVIAEIDGLYSAPEVFMLAERSR